MFNRLLWTPFNCGSFVLDFLGQIIPWEDKYSEIKWSDLYPLKGYDIKSAS